MVPWGRVTLVMFFITLLLFTVSRITLAQTLANECQTHDECHGDQSVCNHGRCICDVEYFHPVLRCDTTTPVGFHLLSFITTMFLLASLGLCCLTGILHEQRRTKE